MRRYGHGKMRENEDVKCCIANVWNRPYDHQGPKQCSRKRGYGKNSLFCKQHAKVQTSERGFLSYPQDKEAR